MIKRLVWTNRRRLLGVAVICVAVIASLAMLQTSKVAEAAILYPHADSVGWWRFDEGTGNIAEDSSGYGNNGTIYGATLVDSEKYGKALSFDGTDDYVNIPHNNIFDLSNGSFAFWLYRYSADNYASWKAIISKGWSSGFGIFTLTTNMLGFQMLDETLALNMRVYTLSVLDDWVFVTITWDGTDLKWYENGIIKKTDPLIDYSLATGSSPVNLAKDPIQKARISHIQMDEVRIYNRALSEAEIQENFQKGPDFSSRLLAKVPKGTTQFIATLSWQGIGSIDAAIESPSETYTEDLVSVYQKTVYSSSSGDMLNIKRLAVSVTALSNEENWYIILEFNDVEDYKITVEVQR